MKKFFSILLAAALAISASASLASCTDTAEDDVYVTITNGNIILAYDDVDLRDADGDGAFTISDALYLAHEENFSGGATAGYANEMTDYGLSLTKLWGVENGGSYGYMLNNASAMSLLDEVKPGDHIVAYVYTDLVSWSDTFCYFDKVSVELQKAGEVELTLTMNAYDESWSPITLPVAGATITFDGATTEYVTDENGKVTLRVNDDVVISAVSDTLTLVPPICVVDVD